MFTINVLTYKYTLRYNKSPNLTPINLRSVEEEQGLTPTTNWTGGVSLTVHRYTLFDTLGTITHECDDPHHPPRISPSAQPKPLVTYLPKILGEQKKGDPTNLSGDETPVSLTIVVFSERRNTGGGGLQNLT